MSQFPSSVYILTANPRTSRTVSALPLLPCTVEKRTNTGVLRDVSVSTPACVRFSMLFVSLKLPKAPVPRACTTRSGMRSWSKRWIFSRAIWSSSSDGPTCWSLPAWSQWSGSVMPTPWSVAWGFFDVPSTVFASRSTSFLLEVAALCTACWAFCRPAATLVAIFAEYQVSG